MVNDEAAPTGRPAGALGWAGVANLFYWIDRQNGVGGFWATQVLPFSDPTSFGGFMDFETDRPRIDMLKLVTTKATYGAADPEEFEAGLEMVNSN